MKTKLNRSFTDRKMDLTIIEMTIRPRGRQINEKHSLSAVSRAESENEPGHKPCYPATRNFSVRPSACGDFVRAALSIVFWHHPNPAGAFMSLHALRGKSKSPFAGTANHLCVLCITRLKQLEFFSRYSIMCIHLSH